MVLLLLPYCIRGNFEINKFRFLICIGFVLLFIPELTEAHNGSRDELGGHFRNADCVYLLHEPTSLAQSAQNKSELVQLIQQYNGNEHCKTSLDESKVELEGYSFNSDVDHNGNEELSIDSSPVVTSSDLLLGAKYNAILKQCTDGDTAQFIINGTTYKTRFLYIDTPESTNKVEPFGKEASEFTCAFLQKGKIVLETDGLELFDKYDRLLAWVWVDNQLHQEEITKIGLVKKFYDYGNYKYEDRIHEAMEEARSSQLGLYGKEGSNSNHTSNENNLNQHEDVNQEEPGEHSNPSEKPNTLPTFVTGALIIIVAIAFLFFKK
ncbi:thermonuclease family protein [Litchfieldia alkalitelluris]|uniref:thermonuclease family protein n=1 Tax=Litchfieldia alkalitelluris TaxID=304268 RepID=UPI0009962195|nr:thermonuclease family protein [Litchfieldia alkalitelluris]